MYPFSRSLFNRLAKPLTVTRGEEVQNILADGEFQASKLMTETVKLYGEAPVAIKLKELQTLAEIAREKNLIKVTPSGDVSTGNR